MLHRLSTIDHRPSVLIVSNGYGEDAVGHALAHEFLARRDAVTAYPLVGLGHAYREVPLLDPRRSLPSGGFGLRGSFAQVVADHLGVTPDEVTVLHGDTRSGPEGFGTFGSRSVALGGSALARVSAEIRDKGRRIAAKLLEAAPAEIHPLAHVDRRGVVAQAEKEEVGQFRNYGFA